MQWRIATVENGSLKSCVIEHLLCILQLREPHAHMLKIDARSQALLSVLRSARITCIHSEGNEGDVLENRFTSAIASGSQVGNVFDVAKGFVGQFNQEDGKGDVGWHVLHIHCHCVSFGIVTVAPYNRHQPGCVGEGGLDTTGY